MSVLDNPNIQANRSNLGVISAGLTIESIKVKWDVNGLIKQISVLSLKYYGTVTAVEPKSSPRILGTCDERQRTFWTIPNDARRSCRLR